jgi:hypothetical protein
MESKYFNTKEYENNQSRLPESEHFNTKKWENSQPKLTQHLQAVITEKAMGKGIYYQMRENGVSDAAMRDRIRDIAKRVMDDILNKHTNTDSNEN